MPIKVIINGANGKMGQMTVESIQEEPDLQLVASTGRQDDLTGTIKKSGAEVVIDFTTPESVFENTIAIINSGAHPLIGTTGLSNEQIKQLEELCNKRSLGAIIAPNFSLGAVLMMKYAKDAAKYFSHAEIVEMHHPHKLDAPSGTAKKTAALIAQNRPHQAIIPHGESPARGENVENVMIHAIRLPGVIASQVVMFGNHDETLTIRHDPINRKAFMPGIFFACRKVMELDHLIYGLENLL